MLLIKVPKLRFPHFKRIKILQNATEKANILNEYFQIQSLLDDSNKEPALIGTTNANELSSIKLTPLEVKTTLHSLPLGKDAGREISIIIFFVN